MEPSSAPGLLHRAVLLELLERYDAAGEAFASALAAGSVEALAGVRRMRSFCA